MTEAERRENNARWVWAMIAAALVGAIPGLVGIGLLQREVNDRITETQALAIRNKALIVADRRSERERAELRVANRIAVRRADLALCRSSESLKRELRAIIAFDREEVLLTLDQLGVPRDSKQAMELLRRSERNALEAAARLAPRKGGCESLPQPTDTKEGK